MKLERGVYKRGEWYHYDFTFNGERKQGRLETTNAEIANQKVRDIRTKLERGEELPDPKVVRKAKLFRNEMESYITRKTAKWSPKTLEMHNTSLPKLLAYFGDMDIKQIKFEDLQFYQAKRKAGLIEWEVERKNRVYKSKDKASNTAINRELALVRQLLKDHKLWLNLIEDRERLSLRENKNTGKAVAGDQVISLLDAMKELTSRILYPACMFTILTGLRDHEVKNLRWRDIDWVNSKVSVTRDITKTDAGEREVDLNPLALDLIKDWRTHFEALGSHYVFPSHKYNHGLLCKVYPEKPYKTWWRSFDEARKAAGVYCRWHDFRHTCASIVGGNGASRATLKALFGWMDDKMLDRYLHSNQQAKKAAMETVGDFFNALLAKQEPQQLSVQ